MSQLAKETEREQKEKENREEKKIKGPIHPH